MKVEQRVWTKANGWSRRGGSDAPTEFQLVILFADTGILKEKSFFEDVRKLYPNAHLFGCSTSSEICFTSVYDGTAVATAVRFDRTEIMGARLSLSGTSGSLEAGGMLARSLRKEGLRHVLVLADGIGVNGSDLVKGLERGLPEGVTITGGLAGDSARFRESYVFWDDFPSRNTLAILGFYGDGIRVGFGSMGGWDPFGPERVVTKSKDNLLFELDGRSALDLYKKYLGDHGGRHPDMKLFFPLSIRTRSGETGIVRAVMDVDEKEKSMTFGGDVPVGAYARFMKANFERLIDGAGGAALRSREGLGGISPDLAILISCVGRKGVLRQRTEEEVEAVRDVLGGGVKLAGFYSCGEICPFSAGGSCALHNQTMTVTTLTEA